MVSVETARNPPISRLEIKVSAETKGDEFRGQVYPTACSAMDHALRLPTPETDRRGDPPCFLGRKPLPHPMRCR